ncbi:MAG TPA: M15 family metallopeptidase [Clostridiales bacterium]|nr:M15 family metallopeptidase [Clostridiales bacterium]
MPVDNNGNIDVGSISKGEKQRYLSLGIGAFIIIMIFSTVLMLMGGQFHDPDQNKPIKNQEFGEKTVIPVEDMTMGSRGSTIISGRARMSRSIRSLAMSSNTVDQDAKRMGSLGMVKGLMDGHKNKTSDRGFKGNEHRRGYRKAITADINVEDLDKPQSPLNDWRIMLVNADNPVPKGYNIKLATIEGAVLFDERAADDLKNLLKDCRRETNYQLRVRTGYRSRAIQDGIYRAKIRNHMDRGKSRAEAERLARNYIAVPGTSEHEIGLAVDFNTLEVDFENTPAYKWLEENAHKYGFILRYPKEKQSITKIKYEPWHFRYVGPVHARIMKSYNLCLEEYIDYLRN